MMNEWTRQDLEAFIVHAKAATYVGGGTHSTSCRIGSHDLRFRDGDFAYHDSYFGGSDFLGEEVVYFEDRPIWAENYYGRILDLERITAAEVGQILQASLSQMYKEGRFLGGFQHQAQSATYVDTSDGGVTAFAGKEWIVRDGIRVYELVYHGGLIKD